MNYSTPEHSRHYQILNGSLLGQFSTPINRLPNDYDNEIRSSIKALTEDSEFDWFDKKEMQVMHRKDYLKNIKPTRLMAKFNGDEIGLNSFISETSSSIPYNIPDSIKSIRKCAILKQQNESMNKICVKPEPGYMYMEKFLENDRIMRWKIFVENCTPTMDLVKIKQYVDPQVAAVTIENACEFKFNAWEWYSKEICTDNEYGIRLRNNIVVLINEHCQISKSELSSALNSCPSVNPKLIPPKWFEENLKWVLVKFAAMERSFPERFGRKILTVENVMNQLKYRYHCEIDLVQRSIIRKIVEMDDIPSKRMVLFVSNILARNEIELSDGHYSIGTIIDECLVNVMAKGKIKIGTKLITQGAEIIGLDEASSPLEVRCF